MYTVYTLEDFVMGNGRQYRIKLLNMAKLKEWEQPKDVLIAFMLHQILRNI